MGRLDENIVVRVEAFVHRVVDVADALSEQGRSRRVVEQVIGSGTSVGANTFEADEAMSRADFCRCLAIVIKELNEARFWLRFAAHRRWVSADRLAPLEHEALELKRILGSMVARVRAKDRAPED